MPFKPSLDSHFVVNEIIAANRLEDEYGRLEGFVPLDGWSLSYQAILHLSNYLRSVENPVVVEFGSGSGTIWLANIVKTLNGQVISVEHDQNFFAHVGRALESEGLLSTVDYRLCPLGRIVYPESAVIDGSLWYSGLFDAEIEADAIVIDGPPGVLCENSRLPAGIISINWCNPDCLVVVDDIERPDEIRLSRLIESEANARGYTVRRDTTSNTDFIYLSLAD